MWLGARGGRALSGAPGHVTKRKRIVGHVAYRIVCAGHDHDPHTWPLVNLTVKVGAEGTEYVLPARARKEWKGDLDALLADALDRYNTERFPHQRRCTPWHIEAQATTRWVTREEAERAMALPAPDD